MCATVVGSTGGAVFAVAEHPDLSGLPDPLVRPARWGPARWGSRWAGPHLELAPQLQTSREPTQELETGSSSSGATSKCLVHALTDTCRSLVHALRRHLSVPELGLSLQLQAAFEDQVGATCFRNPTIPIAAH